MRILDAKVLGEAPLAQWIERYEVSHQHPVNRGFHLVGIPLIALSLPLFLAAPLLPGRFRIPTSLFLAGWLCQFAGHAVEGKPPEFLKDWRFLFVGLRWWLSRIQGRAHPPD